MPAVTIINSFEVPEGRDAEFLALWEAVVEYMQDKPGYLSHKLHRAISPDALFRFVNIARWASLAHFEGAHDQGFRELVEQPSWSAFRPHRGLFEVVHEGRAHSGSQR